MIKRLAKCVREYTLAAILSPLCMVGEVAMEVQIPSVMSKLVDLGVETGNMAVVAQYGLLLILCALLSLGFGVGSDCLSDGSAVSSSRPSVKAIPMSTS